MRDKFPEHIPYSDEDFENLWNNAIFVLDANILLNLYQLTPEAVDEFLRIFSDLVEKNRVRIPYHAAHEFLTNRLNKITAQTSEISNISSNIDLVLKNIEQVKQQMSKRHTYFNELTLISEEIEGFLTRTQGKLHTLKDTQLKKINEDNLFPRIIELFDKQVGDNFSDEKLSQIEKEGAIRFSRKIPPGYKDAKKDNGNSFGDLVLWKQIIEFAKSFKKPILFITDDQKEDWWTRINGKTLFPHPLLRKELKQESGQDFHMYTSENFLKYAKEYLNAQISESTIEEVHEVMQDKENDLKSENERGLSHNLNPLGLGVKSLFDEILPGNMGVEFGTVTDEFRESNNVGAIINQLRGIQAGLDLFDTANSDLMRRVAIQLHNSQSQNMDLLSRAVNLRLTENADHVNRLMGQIRSNIMSETLDSQLRLTSQLNKGLAKGNDINDSMISDERNEK